MKRVLSLLMAVILFSYSFSNEGWCFRQPSLSVSAAVATQALAPQAASSEGALLKLRPYWSAIAPEEWRFSFFSVRLAPTSPAPLIAETELQRLWDLLIESIDPMSFSEEVAGGYAARLLRNIQQMMFGAPESMLVAIPFPPGYEQRLFASIIDPRTHLKKINVNPLHWTFIQSLPHLKFGMIFLFDEMVHEIGHNLIEDQDLNTWSRQDTLVEGIAEVVLLEVKALLMRSLLGDPVLSDPYFQFLKSFLTPQSLQSFTRAMTPVFSGEPTLSFLTPYDAQTRWEEFYVPFLRTLYWGDYVADTLSIEMIQLWKILEFRLSANLKEQNLVATRPRPGYRLAGNLNAAPMDAARRKDVLWATSGLKTTHEALKNFYRAPEQTSRLLRAERAAGWIERFRYVLRDPEDPHFMQAALWMNTPRKIRSSRLRKAEDLVWRKHVDHALEAQAYAYLLTRNPERIRKNPDALFNYIVLLQRKAKTLDAFLLMAAYDLATLEDPHTDISQKRYLEGKIESVYVTWAKMMGEEALAMEFQDAVSTWRDPALLELSRLQLRNRFKTERSEMRRRLYQLSLQLTKMFTKSNPPVGVTIIPLVHTHEMILQNDTYPFELVVLVHDPRDTEEAFRLMKEMTITNRQPFFRAANWIDDSERHVVARFEDQDGRPYRVRFMSSRQYQDELYGQTPSWETYYEKQTGVSAPHFATPIAFKAANLEGNFSALNDYFRNNYFFGVVHPEAQNASRFTLHREARSSSSQPRSLLDSITSVGGGWLADQPMQLFVALYQPDGENSLTISLPTRDLPSLAEDGDILISRERNGVAIGVDKKEALVKVARETQIPNAAFEALAKWYSTFSPRLLARGRQAIVDRLRVEVFPPRAQSTAAMTPAIESALVTLVGHRASAITVLSPRTEEKIEPIYALYASPHFDGSVIRDLLWTNLLRDAEVEGQRRLAQFPIALSKEELPAVFDFQNITQLYRALGFGVITLAEIEEAVTQSRARYTAALVRDEQKGASKRRIMEYHAYFPDRANYLVVWNTFLKTKPLVSAPRFRWISPTPGSHRVLETRFTVDFAVGDVAAFNKTLNYFLQLHRRIPTAIPSSECELHILAPHRTLYSVTPMENALFKILGELQVVHESEAQWVTDDEGVHLRIELAVPAHLDHDALQRTIEQAISEDFLVELIDISTAALGQGDFEPLHYEVFDEGSVWRVRATAKEDRFMGLADLTDTLSIMQVRQLRSTHQWTTHGRVITDFRFEKTELPKIVTLMDLSEYFISQVLHTKMNRVPEKMSTVDFSGTYDPLKTPLVDVLSALALFYSEWGISVGNIRQLGSRLTMQLLVPRRHRRTNEGIRDIVRQLFARVPPPIESSFVSPVEIKVSQWKELDSAAQRYELSMRVTPNQEGVMEQVRLALREDKTGRREFWKIEDIDIDQRAGFAVLRMVVSPRHRFAARQGERERPIHRLILRLKAIYLDRTDGGSKHSHRYSLFIKMPPRAAEEIIDALAGINVDILSWKHLPLQGQDQVHNLTIAAESEESTTTMERRVKKAIGGSAKSAVRNPETDIQIMDALISQDTANYLMNWTADQMATMPGLIEEMQMITPDVLHFRAPVDLSKVDWESVKTFMEVDALGKIFHGHPDLEHPQVVIQKRKRPINSYLYIGHPYAVTYLLLRQAKTKDLRTIVTSLGHDILEDGIDNIIEFRKVKISKVEARRIIETAIRVALPTQADALIDNWNFLDKNQPNSALKTLVEFHKHYLSVIKVADFMTSLCSILILKTKKSAYKAVAKGITETLQVVLSVTDVHMGGSRREPFQFLIKQFFAILFIQSNPLYYFGVVYRSDETTEETNLRLLKVLDQFLAWYKKNPKYHPQSEIHSRISEDEARTAESIVQDFLIKIRELRDKIAAAPQAEHDYYEKDYLGTPLHAPIKLRTPHSQEAFHLTRESAA